MTANIKGPNALLRRLRAVMVESLKPQERLDTIVRVIASNMDSKVCSFYVLRADQMLELYSTVGLNPASVHVASLRVGQGLVGTIAASARCLNLSEAKRHPAFAYLPETDENSYNSFLGVPILRAGRVLGVLVVQDHGDREYEQGEVEGLETTAMVLGELIATGELEGLSSKGVDLDLQRPVQFKGIALSDGIGLGRVILHEPRVVVTNLFNEDTDFEITRLHEALVKVQVSLDVLFQSGSVANEGEHRDVLEAYRMFAHDRGWKRRIEEVIRAGLTAEAAVEKVQNDNRARMMRIPDPYLRDRHSDFDDLANRLLRELLGQPHLAKHIDFEGDHVIVARSMGAAELLDHDTKRLGGLVLEEAAPTSHVVIVARALGIPVVGQLRDIVPLAENGNPIIVDGDSGVVSLRAPQDVKDAYREKIEMRADRQKQFAKLKDKAAVSKDGVPITLNMNAGLLMDLPQIEQSGADGIGLYRTELEFMVSSTLPRPGEQEALYSRILDEADTYPVTFRTLDIGGDKMLPYLKETKEKNPALGWRAIRLSLDRQALLRPQIRALLKAASGRSLRMMLPLVTDVTEFEQVRELVKREIEQQTRFGYQMPESLELGCMLEVPNLLYQLDELMIAADFVSVGSNDLFQFMMASDRGNARLANRYSPLSRTFLRVLKQIHDKALEHRTPVSVCGEMAGRPISAMALFGLGYRAVSISPAAIAPIKAMVLQIDIHALQQELLPVLESVKGGVTVTDLLMDFAGRNGIPY